MSSTEEANNLPSLTAPRLRNILLTQLSNPKFLRSVFLWGLTGIGKSSILRQTVAEIGSKDAYAEPKVTPTCDVYGEWGLIDLRVSLLDASDLRGVPNPKHDLTYWLPPEELPLVGQEERFPAKGVLLLDEMNLAEPAVQSAAYSLVLDRKVGKHRLLPGWKVIGAGNLRTESAYTFELGHPLKNRFLHYLLIHDLEVFKQWGFQRGINSDIIGFLNFRSDYLHKDDSESAYAFPTPRSWEYVHEVMTMFTNGERVTNIAACVGQGVASEFMAFLQVQNAPELEALKDVPALLSGKKHVKLDAANFQMAWAFSAGLMSYLRKNPNCAGDMINYLCSNDWEPCREIGRKTLVDIRMWDESALSAALMQSTELHKKLLNVYGDFGVGKKVGAK